MAYINEIIGGVLLALGLITFIICLAAFWSVAFGRTKRGGGGMLEEINSLIKTYTAFMKLIPRAFRHVFALIPFAVILIVAGLYILIRKPI